VPRFTKTIEIARSPQEVFAYLADVSKLPEWQSSLQSASSDDAELRVGSRIREKRKFMGRDVTTHLEVTALERPRRFDLKSRGGPISFEIHHVLEPVQRGTRLRIEVDFKLGAMVRIAARPMLKPAEREFHADFERLEELLGRPD
jgi:carbon monoxide dehydrogenase subunit G